MTAERDRQKEQALSLHLAGRSSLKDIAEILGMTEARARKLLADALDDAVDPSLPERARTEIARIDRAIAAIWGSVENGDLDSIDRFLRLSERREKLATPRPNTQELEKAFRRSAESSKALVSGVDDGIVELGRKTCEQIDHVVATGNPTDVTKALYLQTYVHKALREMLATPAARADAEAKKPAGAAGGEPPKTSKLAQLRSVSGGASQSAGGRRK
jgi:hypothetical protein